MKTDTNNNLSFEHWQQHQSGTGGKQAEELLSGNDLNYLAAKGFEKTNISAADIKDVYKRIDAKAFNMASLNSIFVGGLVVMVMVGGFYLLNTKTGDKEKQGTNKIPPSVLSTNEDEKSNVRITENNANAAAENTTVAAVTTHNTYWNKEHFSAAKPEEIEVSNTSETAIKEELVDMKSTSISSIPVENNTSINIEQLPNAPVIYHKGIKVTDYRRYYFKNNQPFQLINGGLDAFWTDVNDYKASKKELKEGDRTTADAVLRESVELFADQKYTECLAGFDLLLSLDKTDVNANFYSGMSFYFTGKYGKAIACFDQVIVHTNNIFDQEAEFYKALALKKNAQVYEATELLKKIVNDNGFYAQRALAELKKP